MSACRVVAKRRKKGWWGATRATREKAGGRPRVDGRDLGKGSRGLTVSSLTVALSSSTLAMVPARHLPPRPSLASYLHLPSTSTAKPGR